MSVKFTSKGLADGTDDTKELEFNVAGVTTGTTRTITVPDRNLTLGNAGDLTGTLPAISGANLTNLPASGSNIKLTSGTITSATTNIDINVSSYVGTYDVLRVMVVDWTADGGQLQLQKLYASNSPVTGGYYGGYYRVGEGNTSGHEGYSGEDSIELIGTNTTSSIGNNYTGNFDIEIYLNKNSNHWGVNYRGVARLSLGLSSGITGGGVNTNTNVTWGIRLKGTVSTTAMKYAVYGVVI